MNEQQLPPLPGHPEPHSMKWSELELAVIQEYGEQCARAALAMSPKQTSGTSLPPPDMTMPSMTPDGPDGAHYYRASTVRRLLENKGESA